MKQSTPLSRLLKKTSYQLADSGVRSMSLVHAMNSQSFRCGAQKTNSVENKTKFRVGKSRVGGEHKVK